MDGETVYGDVLFVINFSMDFLVLFSTSKIMHLKPKGRRMTLSAAIGGAYSVAALLIENGVISMICNIAVSVIMCLITFSGVKKLTFFKIAALFYGQSLLLGGCVTASYVFLNKLGRGVNINSGIAPVLSDIPLGVFCVLGIVSFAASYITGKIFGKQSEKRKTDVTITNNGKSVTVTCLSDSGALLKDPLSGDPVIIVDREVIKPCLEEKLYAALCDDGFNITGAPIRIIPCSGIGERKLICGFVPEKVEIEKTTVRAVIAAVADHGFGGFDGIVPSSLCNK